MKTPRRASRPWTLLCVLALIGGGCGGGGGGGTPTAPPVPPPRQGPLVTFGDFQVHVFTPTCAVAGCHGSASAQAGLTLAPGVAYGNLVNAPSTEMPGMLRVAPGQPEQSYLLKKLRGDADIVGGRMPLGGPSLSQADLDALGAWIARGAPND